MGIGDRVGTRLRAATGSARRRRIAAKQTGNTNGIALTRVIPAMLRGRQRNNRLGSPASATWRRSCSWSPLGSGNFVSSAQAAVATEPDTRRRDLHMPWQIDHAFRLCTRAINDLIPKLREYTYRSGITTFLWPSPIQRQAKEPAT